MKTLDDVKLDMSELYESVKNGGTDLRLAAELSNIAGKYLKAAQLDLAREIFIEGKERTLRIQSPKLPVAMSVAEYEEKHGKI